MVGLLLVCVITGAWHAPVNHRQREESDDADGRISLNGNSPAGRKGTFDGRRLSKVLLRYFRRK